jgi:hypothetical protein
MIQILKTTAILAVLAQFACAQDQFEFGNLLEVRVEKADIPTEAEQSEALNKVRNAFHRKYQLATTKSEKETLVRQMLQISKDTEGANKYAVLKVSRDIAVLIGNAELAYQSILEMDEYFKVDLIDLKSEVLIGLSKTVSLGQRSNFANECLNVAEQALQQDKFDKAEELLGLIRSYAPRLPIGKSYADLNREVGIAKRQYKEIQIYIHKLAAHPEDSIAAVKVGEYYLKRGQWNKALELLAKSKTSLGELARLDLKSLLLENQNKVAIDGVMGALIIMLLDWAFMTCIQSHQIKKERYLLNLGEEKTIVGGVLELVHFKGNKAIHGQQKEYLKQFLPSLFLTKLI